MAFSPQGLNRLLNSAVRAFRALSGSGSSASGSGSSARPRGTTASKRPKGTLPGNRPQPRGGGFSGGGAGTATGSRYAGDYLGAGTISYSPEADGSPDPGEIVWTWVPYQEDYSQGKDRPVLVIGNHRGRLLALMLTSRDRNNARSPDEDYVDIGSGPWDVHGRPSEIKLDRVLQLEPAAVRREGAVLPRATFEKVAQSMRRRGWK
ncbi:type II toxin-antitoxin system PemK/MazF family toxin [Arthrobacter sp. NPDC089319]|uniref:type II toxin-antitoxin system PemK/MazF family toxin n=1 Tax=Arthrobacter sp. NPDC089319 TaxID=3155915 RepID=UPI00341CD28B